MKNQKEISEEEYNFLRASGTQPGILYGLPKIHEIGTPLRPIKYLLQQYYLKLLA